MAAVLYGVRVWIFRLSSVLCALVVGLLIAEGAIRIFPSLLNEKLRYAAFSRYNTLPGGIYLTEGITRIRFMRADFATRAYSHGRFWAHRTDADGFRNPPDTTNRDLVLLGDSLVYGHGVDDDQTLAHFLRTDHGVAAYDMSAQGQCLYENYVMFRLYGDRFRPTTALLFIFVNDVRDIAKRGRPGALPDLPEVAGFDYDCIQRRVDALRRYREPWPLRAAFSSAIVRMAARSFGWRPSPPPESTTPKKWRPTGGPSSTAEYRSTMTVPGAILDRSRFAPVERYIDAVLADLARRCAVLGTRLVVIHIEPPMEEPWRARELAQARFKRSLDEICHRHNLELVGTSDLFAGRTEWILPDDGHLNPAGNRALADFLYANVLDES